MNREQHTLELVRKYRNGQDTRNKIIQLNMPLIKYLVQKYGPKKVDFDDALSYAMEAYIGAIDQFDASKGVKFSTFAGERIKFKMKNLWVNASRLKRRVNYEAVSLNQPLDAEQQATELIDMIAAPEKRPSIWFEAGDLIESVIKKLSSQHQKFINDYLKKGLTQRELADKYQVSRSAIWAAERKFFDLLKHNAEIKGYRKKEEQTVAKQIMTVTDYANYVNNGLTDREIADRLNHNVKSVQNFHYRHRSEIDKLLKNQPKTAEKAVKTVKNEVNGQIENKCYVSEDNYKAVVVERDQLKKQVQALKLDINEKQTLISEIEDENKTYKESYGANQNELEAAYGKNRAIADENDQLKQKIETLAQEIADIRKTKNEAFSQVDLMQCKLEAQTGRLKAAEAYIVAVLDPDQ